MVKNQIQYLVDEINKPVDKLTILMTSTHPMTDVNICYTEHEFYNLDIQQFPIKWPSNVMVPSNMHIIKDINELPYRPDVIISQNIVDQYGIFKQLSYMLDVPLIEFEHTMPTMEWVKSGTVEAVKQQTDADAYVYITDYSRRAWGRDSSNGKIIYHMVEQDFYNGWIGGNGRAMILVNQFKGREWAVGNPVELMLKSDLIDLYGHNIGYQSESLSKLQVVDRLRNYDVFINTSIQSPLPASLLEAASVGTPILSRKTCAIPDFFVDNDSIMFYETIEEAIEKMNMILNSKELQKRLSIGAQQVIQTKFSKDRYIADWNQILNEVIVGYHAR